jgi:hypothetical protein
MGIMESVSSRISPACELENAMNIELEYTLKAEDIAEFTMAYLKIARKIIPRSRYWAAQAIPLIAAIFVAIGIAVTLQIAQDPSPAARDLVPNTILALLPWVLIVLCVITFLFRRRLRGVIFRQSAQRKMAASSDLAQLQQVKLSETGLIAQSPTAHSSCTWAHFLLFAETEHLFVLFTSLRLPLILPKRAFPSAEAMQEFRGFAQAHVGNQPIGFPVQPAKNAETAGRPGT